MQIGISAFILFENDFVRTIGSVILDDGYTVLTLHRAAAWQRGRDQISLWAEHWLGILLEELLGLVERRFGGRGLRLVAVIGGRLVV